MEKSRDRPDFENMSPCSSKQSESSKSREENRHHPMPESPAVLTPMTPYASSHQPGESKPSSLCVKGAVNVESHGERFSCPIYARQGGKRASSVIAAPDARDDDHESCGQTIHSADQASSSPLGSRRDIIADVLDFCPRHSFLFFGGVNKAWKAMWTTWSIVTINRAPREKATSVRLAATTHARTEWALGDPDFECSARKLGGLLRLTAAAGNLGGLRAAAACGNEFLPASRFKLNALLVGVTQVAAEGGHLEVLKWAAAKGYPLSWSTCRHAAKGGHLSVLHWVRGVGCPWNETACSASAESGNLEVLQWVRGRGCPWDETTCSAAALKGHLNILKWARQEGCPWDKRTCEYAAKGGHLEVLQWARDQGCAWDRAASWAAAFGGHLTLLRWASEHGCPLDVTICNAAAEEGHLEVFKWAMSQGVYSSSSTCTWAARGGHLEVLKWARSHGCPWDLRTCSGAAGGGHLDVLKWARERRCPWNELTCSAAAEGGHLGVLQWARSSGCAWDDFTCSSAAENGHLEVLQWARGQGCPWDKRLCELVSGGGEVADWIRQQR